VAVVPEGARGGDEEAEDIVEKDGHEDVHENEIGENSVIGTSALLGRDVRVGPHLHRHHADRPKDEEQTRQKEDPESRQVH
jgi:hypothetical protein